MSLTRKESSESDDSSIKNYNDNIYATDSDQSDATNEESLINEVELIGVLSPEDDDNDDDDYIPHGRTKSGNFPNKVPKSKAKEFMKIEEKRAQKEIIEKLSDFIVPHMKLLDDKTSAKKIVHKEAVIDSSTAISATGKNNNVTCTRSVSSNRKKVETLAMSGERRTGQNGTEKRTSQWEDLMRKFSEAHKEECKSVSLDIPRAPRSVKHFPTGSMYQGTWDILGMSGYGTYTFPNGVIYIGEFEDGMFHGRGELRYPKGVILRGTWKKGHMIHRTLFFADGLEYSEQDWEYCKMPDRRFSVEYEKGLQPDGKPFLTADQPTREIPTGCYDAGDGFYNPKTKIVHRPDDSTSIIRSAGPLEAKWMVDNCRSSSDEPVGPRQDLYEKWLKPQCDPEPLPNPTTPSHVDRRNTELSEEIKFVTIPQETPEECSDSLSSCSSDSCR